MLGRVILIDFIPRQVIGVTPRSFQFLNLAPDVLLPQRLSNVRSDEFSYGKATESPLSTARDAHLFSSQETPTLRR